MSEKEGEIVLRKRERSEIEDTKVGVEKEGRERERERESSGERDEKVMYEEWKIGCGKFKMSGPPKPNGPFKATEDAETVAIYGTFCGAR